MAYTEYTQLKVKAEYRDKLKKLAQSENRSMANMLEVLIESHYRGIDLLSERPDTNTRSVRGAKNANREEIG
jgi:hypothetical protein